MDPFITHTGRAVPLRRASVGSGQILQAAHVRLAGSAGSGDGLRTAWRQDPAFVLNHSVINHSAYAGATILISGPDFGIGSARALPARALADYGIRVVLSAGFDDILYDDMIQAGIVLARLPGNAVDKLLHAVEADPRIPVAIDLDRREVSARGAPCTLFEIAEYARQHLMAGTDALADRLLAAQRSLASCGLGVDLRIRLQRRLMAICDATKAPGADTDRCKRRVEQFFEELDRGR